MISLIRDPGFEDGTGGRLEGHAALVRSHFNSGTRSLRIRLKKGGDDAGGSAYTTLPFPVVPGMKYWVDFAANSKQASHEPFMTLLLEVDHGFGAWEPIASLFPNLYHWEFVGGLHSFTALSSLARLRFSASDNAASSGTWDWYIDDVVVMAEKWRSS